MRFFGSNSYACFHIISPFLVCGRVIVCKLIEGGGHASINGVTALCP